MTLSRKRFLIFITISTYVSMGLLAASYWLIENQYREYVDFALNSRPMERLSFSDFYFQTFPDSSFYTLLLFIGIWIFSLSIWNLWKRILREKVLPSLEPSSGVSSSDLASTERTLSGDMESLRREVDNRFRKIERASKETVPGDLKSMAESIVREKLNDELGDDLVSALGKRISEHAADHAKRLVIREFLNDLFSTSRTRINDQALSAERTARMFRRTGITLAWAGILLAAVNLIVFYADLAEAGISVSLPGGKASPIDYSQMLKHLPFTLPFIMLAEVLALIMLRYQSKALEMMRYFSNEVTTLNLRQAGSLLLVEHGSQKNLAELSKELLKSERNIIMRKDEKTLELAQNRDEDALLKSFTDKIETILKRERESKSGKTE